MSALTKDLKSGCQMSFLWDITGLVLIIMWACLLPFMYYNEGMNYPPSLRVMNYIYDILSLSVIIEITRFPFMRESHSFGLI